MSHPDPDARPVVEADALSLVTKRGPVFERLTFDVLPGQVVAVCGPAGSGRSMALLTVAGRAVPTGGSLLVAGATTAEEIRRHVAVARIGGAVEPEPDLTVAALLEERRLFGAPGRDPRWAARGGAVVGELSALERLMLAVALAAMERTPVVVVDDVDLGLDDAERATAWADLTDVAAAGPAIVASCAQAPAGIPAIMLGGIACAS